MIDASLRRTCGLPALAGTTYSNPVDLQLSPRGLLVPFRVELSVPALTVEELADGETMTYELEFSQSVFFTAAESFAKVIVQEGGAGGGAPEHVHSFELKAMPYRWMRLKVTNSGAGDASAKTVALLPIF
ncbi:MAG: hypothetical protein ACK5Q5_23990 [Planctomycetaceae bacterium]